MKSFKLYLPPESEQDIICERWIHMFQMVDKVNNEKRIYTAGLDFAKSDSNHKLPYGVIDGKKSSFESCWKQIVTEEDITSDGYIPKDYD